jgi:hypothetical protein
MVNVAIDLILCFFFRSTYRWVIVMVMVIILTGIPMKRITSAMASDMRPWENEWTSTNMEPFILYYPIFIMARDKYVCKYY